MAAVHAFVGFGGASSYLALLTVSDVPDAYWRLVSLVCNVVVVGGGGWHFARRGHFSWKLLGPFAIASIPMAYLGGTVTLERAALLVMLGGCLVAAGLRGLIRPSEHRLDAKEIGRGAAWAIGLPVGALLGGLSGLVGIGGGVFLAPVLYTLGWGNSKQVAAVCSAFILLNSAAGLAGILVESDTAVFPWELLWLPVAAFVAGQVGSRLGSAPSSSPRLLTLVTSLLVLALGARCLWKGTLESGVF